MTGADVLTLLMSRLGNRTEPDLRATCLLEMNLAQQTVLEGAPYLPWFLVAEESTTLTVAGERRVVMPTDFIRQVDEERPLYYRDSEGENHELTKSAYDRLERWYGTIAQGVPEAYAVRENYFLLFPKPDNAYTLMLPGYYSRQAAIVDGAEENQWLKWAPDLVLAVTGVQIAEKHIDLEPVKVAGFKQDIILATDRLSRMETAREEAGRHRRMG